MSINSSLIKCGTCDYSSSMGVNHGIFYYVSEGKEYNVERSYGWCYDCNEFSSIEALRNTSSLVKQLKETQNKITNLENTGFWYKLTSKYKKLKEENSYYLEYIEKLKWRIEFLKGRSTMPKCLTCGSDNVTMIDVYELDYYNDGIDRLQIGFAHPGCGGELWIVKDHIRGIIKFTPRYYDLDGIRIDN